MLLAIYRYEGSLRYKILTGKRHLKNWLNKYFSHVELEFIEENNFHHEVPGDEGLVFPAIVYENTMLILDAETVTPDEVNIKHVTYGFDDAR